jgi:hypothetical protein
MITPMSLYAAALWGLIGAGAMEAWELYGAIHRLRGFPWNKPGEVAMAPFLVAVALRLLLGIGLATAFVASGQADGPVGALAVGIAAPKLLEQLAQHTVAPPAVEGAQPRLQPVHAQGSAEEGSHAP